MDLYKTYGTNKDKEKQGVWIMFDDTGFKVRRFNMASPAIQKKLEELMRPHRQAIKMNKLDDELNRKLAIQLFVETCMIDWKNVSTRDGKNQKFSFEAAIQLFIDLEDVYLVVSQEAQDIKNFQGDDMEGDAKNSKTSSTTT